MIQVSERGRGNEWNAHEKNTCMKCVYDGITTEKKYIFEQEKQNEMEINK